LREIFRDFQCFSWHKNYRNFFMCDTTATVSEPDSPTKPNRRAIRRRHLLDLILSLLTPQQIRRLRVRYAKGKENIAELSRISHCPPVLLYCVLTPLWSQTPVKLRLLRVEKQVTLLLNRGMSETRIATELKLPLAVVREHGAQRFGESVAAERPWYQLRAPKPKDPNLFEYDESTLPPTNPEIAAAKVGRCETCGHLVSLPCLACRVRADMTTRVIPPATESDEQDEDEYVEPDLLLR
jgi:hypothetical protein